VEGAVHRLAIETRGTGGRLRLGLAAMPLHAVAIGYQCMRGSFGPSGLSIDVFDAVGKQKPQAKIAVLALKKQLLRSCGRAARDQHLFELAERYFVALFAKDVTVASTHAENEPLLDQILDVLAHAERNLLKAPR
jgi:hypothetical protein